MPHRHINSIITENWCYFFVQPSHLFGSLSSSCAAKHPQTQNRTSIKSFIATVCSSNLQEKLKVQITAATSACLKATCNCARVLKKTRLVDAWWSDFREDCRQKKTALALHKKSSNLLLNILLKVITLISWILFFNSEHIAYLFMF